MPSKDDYRQVIHEELGVEKSEETGAGDSGKEAADYVQVTERN